MSAFSDWLNSRVGEAGDQRLIAFSYAVCWHYAFAEAPLYLWAGRSVLITQGGQPWFGTIDQRGRNHHTTPNIGDGRDGTSVQVKFGVPYLDQVTYEKFADDQDAVNGTIVTAYIVPVDEGEGLRPAMAPKYLRQYTLQSATFRESRADTKRSGVKVYAATAIGKNGNHGRSQSARGTMTDPCQQERAAYWGEAPDYGAGFVAELARATRQFP